MKFYATSKSVVMFHALASRATAVLTISTALVISLTLDKERTLGFSGLLQYVFSGRFVGAREWSRVRFLWVVFYFLFF